METGFPSTEEISPPIPIRVPTTSTDIVWGGSEPVVTVKLTVRLALLPFELKVIVATPLLLVGAEGAEIVPESTEKLTSTPGITAFLLSLTVAVRVTNEEPSVWIVGASTVSPSWVAVWVAVPEPEPFEAHVEVPGIYERQLFPPPPPPPQLASAKVRRTEAETRKRRRAPAILKLRI